MRKTVTDMYGRCFSVEASAVGGRKGNVVYTRFGKSEERILLGTAQPGPKIPHFVRYLGSIPLGPVGKLDLKRGFSAHGRCDEAAVGGAGATAMTICLV